MNTKEFFDLSKSTAIITGGAGLLGRVYTSSLLNAGAKVFVIDKKIIIKKTVSLLRKENKLNPQQLKNLNFIQCMELISELSINFQLDQLKNTLPSLLFSFLKKVHMWK